MQNIKKNDIVLKRRMSSKNIENKNNKIFIENKKK